MGPAVQSRKVEYRLPRGASATAVLHALQVLAAQDAPHSKREPAARTLLQQLHLLAPSCARRDLQRLSRIHPQAEQGEALRDAIQHVAMVASTGRSRFQGDSPIAAIAWCSRVLNNHLLTEIRWRHRHQARQQALSHAHAVLQPEHTQVLETAPALLDAQRILQRVRAHLQRTRQPKAAMSLFRAVCCYLDSLRGVTQSQQIARWCPETDLGDAGALRRARNCLYQYHRRARAILQELQGARVEAASNGDANQ